MRKPYVWPTRDEWAAQAEYSVRTSCYLHERVSPNPLHWITAEELAETRTLIAEILPIARRGLNRAIRPLLAEFADQPKSGGFYDWYDTLTPERFARFEEYQSLRSHRTHLNASARESAHDWNDVQHLAVLWSRIRSAADKVGAAPELVQRLGEISAKMVAARDAAAEADLANSVAKRIAERNSDAGWAKELKRRAEIDAGGYVTVHRL